MGIHYPLCCLSILLRSNLPVYVFVCLVFFFLYFFIFFIFNVILDCRGLVPSNSSAFPGLLNPYIVEGSDFSFPIL